MPEAQRGRQAVPLEMANEVDHRRRLAMQANAGIPVLRDFTPVLQFGGATTGIVYSRQAGKSVTWAGIVHEAWIDIVLTNKGSATGSATITGLLETNNSGIVVISGDLTIKNAAGAQTGMRLEIDDGTAIIDLYHSHGASTGTGTLIDDSDFTNTSEIHAHVIYRVV